MHYLKQSPVVNSFASFYKNRLWRNEVEHKKKEMTKLMMARRKEMQKMMLMSTLVKTVGVEVKKTNQE